MATQFITVEIALPDSPAALRQAVLAELQTHGEPLRWAVTAVDSAGQLAQVEAIVILST